MVGESAGRRRTPAQRVGVLLAAGASSWEPDALEALSSAPHVVLVKRCLDLSDLLATAATGTAQVAVVAAELPGLDADSVHRLARDGVRTVAVTAARPTGRRADEDQLTLRARLLRLGVARVVSEDAVATLAEHLVDATRQELRVDGPQDGDAALAGFDVSGLSGLSDGSGGSGGAGASGSESAGSGTSARDHPADVPTGGARPHGPSGVADDSGAGGRRGALVAVWGPTGAPGRTTVAIGLAAESAVRGTTVTLVDADPYGGAVGQHLAVLDEVSGLLAAARLANTGQLDPPRLAEVAREIGPGLRLVTGLPRPDRWTDVRPQALVELLEAARALDDLVVVDTGFGLPTTPLDPFANGPGRDEITLAVLAAADRLVVVGSADPVGLTRLVRSLRDVSEVRPGGADVVVVNRMRSSLGWSTREIGDLVSQVAPDSRVAFLPDDRIALDRALVSGRTLVESGDSPLRRAVVELAKTLVPQPA